MDPNIAAHAGMSDGPGGPAVLRAPDTAAVGYRTREHGEGHVAEREELVRIHLVGRGQGAVGDLPVRSAIRRAIDPRMRACEQVRGVPPH